MSFGIYLEYCFKCCTSLLCISLHWLPICRGAIDRNGSNSCTGLQKRDTYCTPCTFFLDNCSQAPVSSAQQHLCWKYLIESKYAGICIHAHAMHPQVCMCASKHTNTNTIDSICVCRNLTGGGILSPSAPQWNDKWGATVLAAASWVQSVWHCAEGGLRQRAGGDGTWVDGQSPSGWDEVHQRGEWKQTQQTTRPSGQHNIASTSHKCKAMWDIL